MDFKQTFKEVLSERRAISEGKILKITPQNKSGWKNKGGTCDRKCTCGSWKKHWKEETGKDFDTYGCSNEECKGSGDAEHGAHVINANEEKEWIVPLCSKCNNSANKDIFPLKTGTLLAWANKAETCES